MADGPRTLIVPTHPGIQYHFCRTGLPVFFLGHWDQFRYWRPQPENVENLLPSFHNSHLSLGPREYRAMLRDVTGDRPHEVFDVAWLHFPWQFKMFRDIPKLPKVYCAAKWDEFNEEEWREILDREDFLVTSFYANTARYLRARFGRSVPFIPIGIDSAAYGRRVAENQIILSVIHSWSSRGWNYPVYSEATEGLPTCHVDHLDRSAPPRDYQALLELFNSARLYLHDGEQEYTIALAEALMSGLPIVSFDLPGVRRYVRHGVNGFVGQTATQIRECCQILLESAEIAARFGAASRQIALRLFPESSWIRRWRKTICAFTVKGKTPAALAGNRH